MRNEKARKENAKKLQNMAKRWSRRDRGQWTQKPLVMGTRQKRIHLIRRAFRGLSPKPVSGMYAYVLSYYDIAWTQSTRQSQTIAMPAMVAGDVFLVVNTLKNGEQPTAEQKVCENQKLQLFDCFKHQKTFWVQKHKLVNFFCVELSSIFENRSVVWMGAPAMDKYFIRRLAMDSGAKEVWFEQDLDNTKLIRIFEGKDPELPSSSGSSRFSGPTDHHNKHNIVVVYGLPLFFLEKKKQKTAARYIEKNGLHTVPSEIEFFKLFTGANRSPLPVPRPDEKA